MLAHVLNASAARKLPFPHSSTFICPADAGDRSRHSVLLGGPHDHDGHRVHWQGAFQHHLPAWPGEGEAVRVTYEVTRFLRQMRPLCLLSYLLGYAQIGMARAAIWYPLNIEVLEGWD